MIFTVSRVNKYIKNVFEKDIILNDIYVTGEISNFKLHSSGHIYFTLKDEYSQINALMFRTYASELDFMPENGMNVTVYGYISVYEKTGQYQLYAFNIVNTGAGLLYEKFERLKKKLTAEGLFDEEHKKAIPEFPKCVAVVTSPTGAAVRDVIRIISRRNKNVKITVVPTLVQGDGAAEDIAEKIRFADRWNGADVLIVGRGGGSMEDLWAFNEEIVARAIYQAETPVISAVGHETDFTIADFAADLRASTPSAAAELAVPETTDMSEKIQLMKDRLKKGIQGRISDYKNGFSFCCNNFYFKNFTNTVHNVKVQLDTQKKRLCTSTQTKKGFYVGNFERLEGSYSFKHFKDRIYDSEIQIEKYREDMERIIKTRTEKLKITYISMLKNLEAVSPVAVLGRGFSITENSHGDIIKSSDNVNIGDRIKVSLQKGSLFADVVSKE